MWLLEAAATSIGCAFSDFWLLSPLNYTMDDMFYADTHQGSSWFGALLAPPAPLPPPIVTFFQKHAGLTTSCRFQWSNCVCARGLCILQLKSLVSGAWHGRRKALKSLGWDGGFCFLWPVTTVFLARNCVVGEILSTAGQWRGQFISCWGGWAWTFFVLNDKRLECS